MEMELQAIDIQTGQVFEEGGLDRIVAWMET